MAARARLGDLREQYRVYRSQLNGVYKSLNRNVTPERVAAAGPQLNAAREQADRVRKAIAATEDQTEKLAAAARAKK